MLVRHAKYQRDAIEKFLFLFLIGNATNDAEIPQNDKKFLKNGIVNGKINSNGNGVVVNGNATYQNGNIKSEVAVINIIDDGKLYFQSKYNFRNYQPENFIYYYCISYTNSFRKNLIIIL